MNKNTIQALLEGLNKNGQYNAEIHNLLIEPFRSLVNEKMKNQAVDVLYGDKLIYEGSAAPTIPPDTYFDISFETYRLFTNGVPGGLEYNEITAATDDFTFHPQFTTAGSKILSFDFEGFDKAAQNIANRINQYRNEDGFSVLAEALSQFNPLYSAEVGKFKFSDIATLREGVKKTSKKYAANSKYTPELTDVFVSNGIKEQIYQMAYEPVKTEGDAFNISINIADDFNKLFTDSGRQIIIGIDKNQESFCQCFKEIEVTTFFNDGRIGFEVKLEQGFVTSGKGVAIMLV